MPTIESAQGSKRMAETTIFYADTINDVFYQIKSIKNLVITGGCTGIGNLPEKMLSIRNIPELCSIERRERYFEFGPGVTLSRICELEKTKLPSILCEAVKSVGNGRVRNMATIGGNICAPGAKRSLFAVLLALDARLEFHNGTEGFTLPFSKFDTVKKGFILTKIRVPIESSSQWDVAVYRRLGASHYLTENSASFAFLASLQKGMLASLRIAFAGKFHVRSQELENKLVGSHLPLSQKNITDVIAAASARFDAASAAVEYHPILKAQYLNLVKYSLEQLT